MKERNPFNVFKDALNLANNLIVADKYIDVLYILYTGSHPI